MRIKTSDLEGAALDWMVAVAIGWSPTDPSEYGMPSYADTIWVTGDKVNPTVQGFRPSTDWTQGGPLIESKRIAIVNATDRTPWLAMGMATKWMDGPTPIIAAMRAIVASGLGDTVDVPEELLT